MFINQNVVTARIDVTFHIFHDKLLKWKIWSDPGIADADTANIPEHVYGLFSLIQPAFAILTSDTVSRVKKPQEHMINLQKKVLHLEALQFSSPCRLSCLRHANCSHLLHK